MAERVATEVITDWQGQISHTGRDQFVAIGSGRYERADHRGVLTLPRNDVLFGRRYRIKERQIVQFTSYKITFADGKSKEISRIRLPRKQ